MRERGESGEKASPVRGNEGKGGKGKEGKGKLGEMGRKEGGNQLFFVVLSARSRFCCFWSFVNGDFDVCVDGREEVGRWFEL